MIINQQYSEANQNYPLPLECRSTIISSFGTLLNNYSAAFWMVFKNKLECKKGH